jgi:multiple sugar transport system permease protein
MVASNTSASAVAPPARSSWAARRQRIGAAYAAPAAVVVTVFFLVPLGLVLWMSLHDWPLIGEPALNAPANYAGIARNALFANAVVFTLKYTVIVTVVLFGAAFGLALLVQRQRPGVGLFRTAFFLPGAVGFATASLLFFAGFNMLILLNGLQAIPEDVYEAARVDGAGRWQQFIAITLPLMRPTIALVLIVMITGSLLAFDQFYIMTNGGPDNATTSIVMVIVREAFTRFDLGSAAAVSVVVLAALIAFNALQLHILRRGHRHGDE